MSKTPFFSIVIPTKDRPHFIGFAIKSLLDQSEKDFECIVVNNSEEEEGTKEVFLTVADDPRFRYVRPDQVLSMPENWELGINNARGKYVSILIDKVMLLPHCLKMSRRILEKNNYDIINWWSDAYSYDDEDIGLQGTYIPSREFRFPERYKSSEEIRRRLSFIRSRTEEGYLYFRGKICFGFYSRELVQGVEKSIGSIFQLFSPDYTSLAAGLAYSKKVYDIGMPGCLSINSKKSNGYQGSSNIQHVKKYIKTCDPLMNLLEKLPYPGIVGSSHNFVAFDYLKVFENLMDRKVIKKMINTLFLSLRIQEDLLKRLNNEENVLSNNKFKILTLLNKCALLVDKFFLKRIFRKIYLEVSKVIYLGEKYNDENTHRNFCKVSHPCSDPLEAVQIAHRHYMQFKSLPYNFEDREI